VSTVVVFNFSRNTSVDKS